MKTAQQASVGTSTVIDQTTQAWLCLPASKLRAVPRIQPVSAS